MTAEAAEVTGTTAGQVTYQGYLIIEWPAPRKPEPGPMPAWGVSLYDAVSGAQICTANRIEIRADIDQAVTADVTMHSDDHGRPHYGSSGDGRIWTDDDGKVRTGTFSFLVAGMRVRS